MSFQGYWQGAPYATAGVDDVSFVAQLVRSISATYCVDPNRIYASGQSNGGGFTGTLACNETTSLVFAAFGAHSGAFYPGHGYTGTCNGWTADVPPCKPSRQGIPFLEIHGDADGQIPYFGGDHNSQCMPAVSLYVTDWAIRDGYGSSNVTTSYSNGNVIKYEFGQSAGNGVVAPVTHYRIAGLGHTWPFNYGSAQWSSSPVVLQFFGNWTLTGPVPAGSAAGSTPAASATSAAASSAQSSTTTLSAAAPTSATISCPSANGLTFTAKSGAQFVIECNTDHSGGDLTSLSASTLNECINACDANSACVDVSLSGNACYLKKSVGPAVSNGVWGARKLTSASSTTAKAAAASTATSSSFLGSSSASSAATSSATASSSVSTSSGVVQTVAAGSTTFTYIGCYSESSALANKPRTFSSTSYSSSSNTVELCAAFCSAYAYFGVEYGSECYCGNSVTSGATSVGTGCTMKCAGNASEYCGGGNRLNAYAKSGTTSASMQGTVTCPSANGQTYTSSTGARFAVECGVDHAGGDMAATSASTFNGCIEACAARSGCVDVSYSGTACYLKSSVGAAVSNDVWGARLVAG